MTSVTFDKLNLFIIVMFSVLNICFLVTHIDALTHLRIKKSKEGYSSLQGSPLGELTYYMGSHSVTCHPAEVTFPPLPQPKLVLDLATPEGCKAELT